MTVEERPLRADAERNRRRLLEAATDAVPRARARGRRRPRSPRRPASGAGTLFRNFASKEDLIAAIVAELMHEVGGAGSSSCWTRPTRPRRCSSSSQEMVGASAARSGAVEAIDDTWLATRRDPRASRGDRRGARAARSPAPRTAAAVRADVGAMDVLMHVQGRVRGRDAAIAQIDPQIDRPPARPGPRRDHDAPRGRCRCAAAHRSSATWSPRARRLSTRRESIVRPRVHALAGEHGRRGHDARPGPPS